MHLAEAYSLASGSKIDKMFVYDQFIPITIDKYVTFHPASKPSKTYNLWQDVLDIIIPEFNKLGIVIIQIGQQGEHVYRGVVSYVGRTDINQSFYIIKNGLGHFGADSYSSHVAGHYDKKLVVLYSNNYVNNVCPYWGNKANQILLEPDRAKHGKPTFSFDENPKTINTISPVEVAESILKLLSIEYTSPYNFLGFEENYKQVIIETVLDQVINSQQMGIEHLFIRADLIFNEQNLINQLRVCKTATVLTREPIKKEIINAFKSVIKNVIFIIDDKSNVEFLDNLKRAGIPFTLLTLENDEVLAKAKLKFFDYGLVAQKKFARPEYLKDKDLTNVYFKTNKFLLSAGKIYQSEASWKISRGIANEISVHENVIDNNDFWKEADFFAFFEKK